MTILNIDSQDNSVWIGPVSYLSLCSTTEVIKGTFSAKVVLKNDLNPYSYSLNENRSLICHT